MIMPFVWMILGAFKTDAEIRQYPTDFWPKEPTLDNFVTLFARLDFATFFFNSVVVAVFVTLGNIVFCSMVGYALAKLEFRGKKLLFALVLSTLMVPGVVTFVPLFVLTANLGLVNSYPGLILPFLITPLGVFLMRQFMLGLPDELIEAARIDGASEWRIFLRVIMPLCGPADRDADDPHVPRELEQLPLAARRGDDRGHVHPPGGARAVLGRPERRTLRPHDGGRRRGRRARADRVRRAAALLRAGHLAHRHQVR